MQVNKARIVRGIEGIRDIVDGCGEREGGRAGTLDAARVLQDFVVAKGTGTGQGISDLDDPTVESQAGGVSYVDPITDAGRAGKEEGFEAASAVLVLVESEINTKRPGVKLG